MIIACWRVIGGLLRAITNTELMKMHICNMIVLHMRIKFPVECRIRLERMNFSCLCRIEKSVVPDIRTNIEHDATRRYLCARIAHHLALVSAEEINHPVDEIIQIAPIHMPKERRNELDVDWLKKRKDLVTHAPSDPRHFAYDTYNSVIKGRLTFHGRH